MEHSKRSFLLLLKHVMNNTHNEIRAIVPKSTLIIYLCNCIIVLVTQDPSFHADFRSSNRSLVWSFPFHIFPGVKDVIGENPVLFRSYVYLLRL